MNHIDRVLYGLSMMRSKSTFRDAMQVVSAISSLQRTCLPEAYINGLQEELLDMIGQPFPEQEKVFVYLTFHGLHDRASFLKIGIAKNVKSRLNTLQTGSPMPRLWAYSSAFQGRNIAYAVEQELLRVMDADRVSGEWVALGGGIGESAAREVVHSLEEAAIAKAGAAQFKPVEV